MAVTSVGIPKNSICFGECELNASALELRRGRRTVKLERIPVQVLLLLIEQRGKVVTREAIADHIWGKGVFLDVDNGINTAIRKIRQVLNDDAQNPRFVETIPGVGYRFIAPINTIEAPVLAVVASHEAAPAADAATSVAESSVARTTAGAQTRGVWIRAAGVLLTLLLIAGIGGWLPWRRFTAHQPAIHSIAVLPLSNLSGDPSEEFFSDGMTDQLITDLAKLGSLRVISRTSVTQYKGTTKSLREIARELNVDSIVEGSVIRSGQRVRVTAQLLEARTDRHIWAETYDRDRGDVLKLQEEVAGAIAQQVRAEITPAQKEQMGKAGAINPAAYDAYIQGRLYFTKDLTADSQRKAQHLFEDAIREDPGFALAYAGLADTYIFLAGDGAIPKEQAYGAATKLVAKAMELDHSIGESWFTLAELKKNFDWDWDAADRAYSQAIALSPSYSCAHEDRAIFLAFLGRRSEALSELAKVDQLDTSWISVGVDAMVYFELRDYPELIEAAKRGLILDPKDSSQHYNLGAGYEGTGRLQEAIAEYQKAMETSDDPRPAVALAHAWAAGGEKGKAEKMLRGLEHNPKAMASPYTMATIYAGLGENDRALESLKKACLEKSFDAGSWITSDFLLDSLRPDPRFQDLLRRVGLSSQV